MIVMAKKYRENTDSSTLLWRAFFSILAIAIIFIAAQTLVGIVPTIAGSFIMGVAFCYAYFVKQDFRRRVNDFLKRK